MKYDIEEYLLSRGAGWGMLTGNVHASTSSLKFVMGLTRARATATTGEGDRDDEGEGDRDDEGEGEGDRDDEGEGDRDDGRGRPRRRGRGRPRRVPVGTAFRPPPGQNPASGFPAPGSHLRSAESEATLRPRMMEPGIRETIACIKGITLGCGPACALAAAL